MTMDELKLPNAVVKPGYRPLTAEEREAFERDPRQAKENARRGWLLEMARRVGFIPGSGERQGVGKLMAAVLPDLFTFYQTAWKYSRYRDEALALELLGDEVVELKVRVRRGKRPSVVRLLVRARDREQAVQAVMAADARRDAPWSGGGVLEVVSA